MRFVVPTQKKSDSYKFTSGIMIIFQFLSFSPLHCVSWSYVLQSSDGCQLNKMSLNKCYYWIKINPLGIWGPGGLVVLTSCVYRLRKFLILSLELPHLV